MNQAIRRIQDGLAKQNLTMRQWALREGFTRQSVSITLKRWAGRSRTPHGGVARDIMARLERTLADSTNDPTEPPPAMTLRLSQPQRFALVRRFLDSGRSRAEAAALAAEAGVHLSTLHRWVTEARAQGQDALPIPVAGDETPVRFPRSAVPPALLAATVGWLLIDPRRTLREAYRHLGELLLAQTTAATVSYVQFTRLIQGMTPTFADLKTLQAAGPVPLRLTKTPKILRRWSDLPAGHTYVGDQHLLDYQCVLPDTGEIVNLQLYLWMDAATTYWVGLAASYGPYTQYTVGLSLLDACRLHVPTALLNDNGRQERSAYVDDLWARLAPHLDVEGSRHYTTPHLPPVKPIEAQMAILTRYLNQEGLTGYRKRDADPFENQQRQGALARAKKAGQLPTIDELLAALARVMARHNTTLARSEVDGDESIPAERFHPGLAGRRLVLAEADLQGLFYPRFQRRVRNASVRVKLGGQTLDFTHPRLAHIAPGESVQVLINPLPPHDGGLALRQDGDRWEPYCLVEPWLGRGADPYADPDTLEALMRQKQNYLNQFRDALKALHAAARARFAPETPEQPSAQIIRLTDAARLRGAWPEADAETDAPDPTPAHGRGADRPKAEVIDHQEALRRLAEHQRQRIQSRS